MNECVNRVNRTKGRLEMMERIEMEGRRAARFARAWALLLLAAAMLAGGTQVWAQERAANPAAEPAAKAAGAKAPKTPNAKGAKAENAKAPKAKEAQPAASAASAADSSTSSSTKNGGMNFDLGGLGKNVHITLDKLRGQKGRFKLDLDENRQPSYLTMIGLVRIESDQFKMECENLSYEGKERILTARYNVNIKMEEIQASCGQLVYDMTPDVITLTVNPDVMQKSDKGMLHIWNIDEFTITRLPNGKMDFGATGERPAKIDILGAPGAPGTETSDRATTDAAREISPDSLQPIAAPTAVPKAPSNANRLDINRKKEK